jgi:hypothetical protein
MHYGSGSGTGHGSRYNIKFNKKSKDLKMRGQLYWKNAASDIEKARFCKIIFSWKTVLKLSGSGTGTGAGTKTFPTSGAEPEPQQIITVPQQCSLVYKDVHKYIEQGSNGIFNTNTKTMATSSVSDPDPDWPDWIRIQLCPWIRIRIRIQERKNDPHTKIEKS